MRLKFAFGNCTNPYINLATEWNLLENNKKDSVTLFLWQNDNTVVIGANQNPYLECDCDQIEADGALIARRRTGGGAVYHDLGNLNFSFIADAENYDVAKQLSVILKAVLSYGIECEFSGRNDITANGRKFSGNAFYNTKNNCLHHGTLLIKTDSAKLKKYLCPRPEKLASKGVKSVESRIINLSEINPQITAKNIIEPLKNAFEKVYGGKASELNIDINNEQILNLAKVWQSDGYIFDKWKNFTSVIKGSFSWGFADVQLRLNGGTITEALIASDSLFPKSIAAAEELFAGKKLGEIAFIQSEDKIIQDLIKLLRE